MEVDPVGGTAPSSIMEAQDILANIAFTTSGALVDCVDSKSNESYLKRKSLLFFVMDES